MNARMNEKGQTLVLIMLAMVLLLAFAGLAVDGGQAYAERRRAQSAADAAAYAAASAALSGENSSQAGLKLAAVNGFSNDGKTNWVTVNNPPVGDGPYGPDSGMPLEERELYYQVVIRQNIAPIFTQFFYGGQKQVTVEAVVKATTGAPATGMNALVSLDMTEGEESMEFDGNITVIIHGGNVWSNNGGIKNGNSGYTKVYLSLEDESVLGNYYTVGTWDSKKRKKMIGNFEGDQALLQIPPVPQPYCPSGSPPKKETYHGVDHYLAYGNNLPSHLNPGIWCIKGDLTTNTEGAGVLIVLLDGGVKYTGNGDLRLTRADDMKDRNGRQWGGMVIYAPTTNTNTFKFGGNSKSLFNGTVYAPGMDCDFGGTPDNKSNHTSMICYTVKIHGNPIVDITYDPDQNFHFSSGLELSQ